MIYVAAMQCNVINSDSLPLAQPIVRHVGSRVTGLGKIFDQWVYFGHFYFIYRSFVLLLFGYFFTVKVMHYFDKNGWGYFLGDFFKSSSGHPGWKQCDQIVKKFHRLAEKISSEKFVPKSTFAAFCKFDSFCQILIFL
jgi:hypothetical protein